MSEHSRIRDNNEYGKVADFLRDKIQPGSSLSIVSAYFTIHAFDKLRTSLTGIDNLRFLFGEPDTIGGIDPSKTESKAFELGDDGLRLENYLTQGEIAKACANWIKEKVEIRSAQRSNFLHGKMYYIDNKGQVNALVGSSNFTVRGLGLSKNASNIELNLEADTPDDCADLKAWFDSLWESDAVEDVREDVLRTLEDAYKDRSPEFIYYKTLYHLFEDFLAKADDPEFAEANQRFHQTEIWQALYLFQRHGVQACLRKLKVYNGCIIADSVGLGKTYEALAIIKYFELRNARVLVMCPKKLEHNWTLYSLYDNNKYNPFKADRFGFRVCSHTDLSRDLPNFEWDAYDLVVIDESHNFRNRGIRYNKLMEDVIQSGGKTQILMLSATPVNNRLTDLENQIRLITEDRDDEFQNTGIPSISGTLNTAQDRFDKWIAETEKLPDKSKRQDSLAERFNADFFTLLDSLTIARSRTHIERFYDDTIKEIGGFPERENPESIYSGIDSQGKFPTYRRISDQIDNYQLSLFNPSRYIRKDCRHHYGEKLLRQREFNLIGMMKVNFLKRLESSVHSFALTLGRTVEKITELETDIEAFLDVVAENQVGFDPLADAEEEYGDDEELMNGIQARNNQTYQFEHLDLDAWLTDLRNDKAQLEKLRKIASNITHDQDAKLEKLKELISEKVQHPTTNKDGKENRKVLVFTAFADTANYLYEHLRDWAKDTLKIESAIVTGGANSTTLGKSDFNAILTNFSPISKERIADDNAQPAPDNPPEIDLLIATDCISEGQNLQDCDYLINYDIHWNPVRIIQRFGRIDRIRSRNKKVRLVNFWPTSELDEYINLKTRVEARMALVNLTATGDDDPLSGKEKESVDRVWTHRDEQLRRMQTDILDFEDIEEQLNLNQFTLDDFRAQLLKYLRKDGELIKNAPLGLYAVTSTTLQNGKPVDVKPGVIFCLRQVFEKKDDKAGDKLNPIHPYYLVYVSDEGDVSIGFSNPKRILERFSALCIGKEKHDPKLCEWFNKETANGSDMTCYDLLLQEGLDSIRTAYSQSVNDQLDASRGDFLIPTAEEQITETTEFELITWLVIA